MMEDMKNLLIQALETRGVLGQIRSKLRSSVFKIVDDQDQKFNMGCGLKWENPTLYKITDTKIGQLSAELIREFMEYLKMDYSLSVFIPECSISPERIRKEDIFCKLGLKPMEEMSETPTLYFILYYFLFSIMTQPDKISEFMNIMKKTDVEEQSEKIITENLKNYFNEQNEQDNIDDIVEDGFVEQNLEYEEPEVKQNAEKSTNDKSNDHMKSTAMNSQINNYSENTGNKENYNSTQNTNQKQFSNIAVGNINKSNENENKYTSDSRNQDKLNEYSNYDNYDNLSKEKDDQVDEIVDEDIEEIICDPDDSYDKSKKVNYISNN